MSSSLNLLYSFILLLSGNFKAYCVNSASVWGWIKITFILPSILLILTGTDTRTYAHTQAHWKADIHLCTQGHSKIHKNTETQKDNYTRTHTCVRETHTLPQLHRSLWVQLMGCFNTLWGRITQVNMLTGTTCFYSHYTPPLAEDE